MCQRWGKPEDWRITPRGCYTLRQQHGRIICHHNCYVGSKRASLSGNKHLLISNKKKSMKTLSWSIYRDQKSQLSDWAELGFRRPGLNFWQSHWSPSPVFLLCASISPPVKWGQWYWFDVRSTGEKSYIRTGTIIIFPHPNTSCDAFFQISLAIKKIRSCSLSVGLYESISWQLFFSVIQSTRVFLRNVVFLLINFLLKDSSWQQ